GSLSFQAAKYLNTGEVPPPVGNHHPLTAPMGVYRAHDGFLNLAVGNDEMFQRFAEVLGQPGLAQDERFARGPARVRNRRALGDRLRRRPDRRARAGRGHRGHEVTEILVQPDGAIATVVFNRPERRNAISLAMWQELARITEGLAKDESVRAVVYRGAGTKAFAAGADISEFQDNRKDRASAIRYNEQTDAAYKAIRGCPKPTVAMVYGFCM